MNTTHRNKGFSCQVRATCPLLAVVQLILVTAACGGAAPVPATSADSSAADTQIASKDGDTGVNSPADTADTTPMSDVQPPDSAADTAGLDQSTDSSGKDGVDGDTSDAVGDDTCKDPHQFNDFKVKDNGCWGPPWDYCSNGCSSAVTKACNPKTGTCCDFGCTCVPCGWTNCTYPKDGAATPGCEKPSAGPTAECLAARPDEKLVICWDGLEN